MTAKELIVELQEILANRFNEDIEIMLDPDFTKDIPLCCVIPVEDCEDEPDRVLLSGYASYKAMRAYDHGLKMAQHPELN
jgi:hypothetical protein